MKSIMAILLLCLILVSCVPECKANYLVRVIISPVQTSTYYVQDIFENTDKKLVFYGANFPMSKTCSIFTVYPSNGTVTIEKLPEDFGQSKK